MAYNSHREPEFTSESTLNEPASADQYTGAFFPGAQSFVIVDGKFKSVTNINYPAPTASPDFRNIPLGDLDLFCEIRLDGGTYLVNHHRGSRRIYPSKVYGIKSNKTVAIYQGKNADEEWKRDISRYSRFRHHNLVQVFGIVNAECGLHAAVFNDELIPAQHVLEKYGASHLSTVYLLVRLAEELEDAQQFINSLSETFMPLLDITEWIRVSTGTLCIDLGASGSGSHTRISHLLPSWKRTGVLSLLQPHKDSEIIDSISLGCYHMASFHLQSQVQYGDALGFDCSVRLGAVSRCVSPTDFPFGYKLIDTEIACIPHLRFLDTCWSVDREGSFIMENGWTRVSSSVIRDENEIILMVGSSPFPRKDGYITDAIAAEYWLSQANCIFSRLDITSGYDDYVLVTNLRYWLRMSRPVGDIPAGYLFLRPLADFESDTGRFRLPDCEGDAYWSLDPSGVERLSMEEATNLGFPFMDFDMEIYGFSWDASAYAGLRQFHLGKGFDPESQDVARRLSLPLYQVIDWDGVEAPLTHVPGIDSTTESEARSPPKA
ncbi:hypothetical protein B0H10DRAFT_2436888 [Mycena sp. CBHHK59/15]|nr:hypothetical protein B0H10DRAFT_2436888 [Mycena sp. CBHHK59/15]